MKKRKSILNSKVNIVSDNRGMTMAEILIAFVVLMVLLGSLSGLIAFSANMYNNSVDMRKGQAAFMEEMYKKGVPASARVKSFNAIGSMSADNKSNRSDINIDANLYFLNGSEILDASTDSNVKEAVNMDFLFFDNKPTAGGGGTP